MKDGNHSFFSINLKKKTDFNFFVWYHGAAAWEKNRKESQTLFSFLISDSSPVLCSTVRTGYFFLSISRTDLWSQGKDNNTNTLQGDKNKRQDTKHGFSMARCYHL